MWRETLYIPPQLDTDFPSTKSEADLALKLMKIQHLAPCVWVAFYIKITSFPPILALGKHAMLTVSF